MKIRMPRALMFLLLVAALLLSACQIAPPAAPAPVLAQPTAAPAPQTATPTPTPPRAAYLQADKITSQALDGNLLNDPTTRRFYVLLPANYHYSEKRYPVLYVLPWGPGHAGGGFDGFEVQIRSNPEQESSREMILVSPDASNALGASLFRSSPTIGDYETYITQELVDYVDSHYRTLPVRESRGIAGCSNGADGTMHLALKFPEVFAVAAATSGMYLETPEQNSFLLKELAMLKSLPEVPAGVRQMNPSYIQTAWYIQLAGGVVPNPNNPPLYLDMPFRIVDGHAEIVPEVSAKITEADAAHLAQHYLQQPYRLSGLLIQRALKDSYYPPEPVLVFEALLTELGIEHEYVEKDAFHCQGDWEVVSLEFMAQHLVFKAAGK